MKSIESNSFRSKKSFLLLLYSALLAGFLLLALSWIAGNPQYRIPLVVGLAMLAGIFAGRFLLAFRNKRSVLRKIWRGFQVLVSVALVLLSIQWKRVTDDGGQVREEPFRIAGNLYYVGTKDVTSFLLAGPEGHVLIDGGYPGTANLIMKNIRQLGFRITDVKILLNTHAHFDHAGGLAALQEASGAQLWISEADADIVASGGLSNRSPLLMNAVVLSGLAKYPAPRIDHRFGDGAKVRLGPLELTAHLTPGHTPGCTTWSFTVHDGDRELLVVDVGSLTLVPVALIGERYDAQQQQEFRQSYQTLRGLPADIFLGSHANFFQMRRKIKSRAMAADSVSPFIDREGYLEYIADAERQLNEAVAGQRTK